MKKLSKALSVVLGMVLVLGFFSCQTGTTFTETAATPQKTAGSISYATTTVEKTTADEAFTNELTKTGDGTVSYTSSKEAVATVDASTGEVTIVGVGTATITATVTDSDTYTYATKTANYIIKVINIIGTKAPGVGKDVGDIVFTDGSAMPYADFNALDDDAKNEKKTFAIALIFYKGTGLNSGNDTTTSRTLGVGLKHLQYPFDTCWCDNRAAAYNINITTVQCKSSGSDGALTFTDETANDRNGSDNFEQIAAFLTSADGVTDDTVTNKNSYGAFQRAKNYKNKATNITGTAYEDGWYIPSLAELFQIYANGKGANKVFDIDSASIALDGHQFYRALYWSSSQSVSEANMACTISFMEGKVMEKDKKDYAPQLCYIREFN